MQPKRFKVCVATGSGPDHADQIKQVNVDGKCQSLGSYLPVKCIVCRSCETPFY